MEVKNLPTTQQTQPQTFFGNILRILLLLIYLAYSYIHLLYRFIRPKRLKSLDGEVFLVTGSASGIGREVVYHIAKHHPKTTIVLWDSNEAANQHILDSVKLLGVDVFMYTVDVTDRKQVEHYAKRVYDEVGYVTILFNNAGVVGLGDLLSQKPEHIQRTIDVNLTSHFWILRAFLPEMIEQNYGHIVTTCSLAGHIGIPYDAPYVASKFGVKGYLESVKAELRLHPLKPKIRFTTVFPSFVNTPLVSRIIYKIKLQSYFDRLEPRHVAQRIVEGIQRNEENVVVPWTGEFLVILKGLMPHRAFQRLMEFFLESVQIKE